MMLLLDSRREARFRDGELVLLADQDRSLWDAAQIAEGRAVLDRALALRGRGPYVVQAAIASLHAEEPRDWAQIAALYGELARAHRLAGRRAEPGRSRWPRRTVPQAGLEIVDRLAPRGLPLPARHAGRAAAPARSHRRGPRRLRAGAGARPRRRRAAAARAAAGGAGPGGSRCVTPARGSGPMRPGRGPGPLRATVIETPRLKLEPLAPEHAEEMSRALDDPRLHEFIGGRPATAPGARSTLRPSGGRAGQRRWRGLAELDRPASLAPRTARSEPCRPRSSAMRKRRWPSWRG